MTDPILYTPKLTGEFCQESTKDMKCSTRNIVNLILMLKFDIMNLLERSKLAVECSFYKGNIG